MSCSGARRTMMSNAAWGRCLRAANSLSRSLASSGKFSLPRPPARRDLPGPSESAPDSCP
jgi:hypothetical protein